MKEQLVANYQRKNKFKEKFSYILLIFALLTASPASLTSALQEVSAAGFEEVETPDRFGSSNNRPGRWYRTNRSCFNSDGTTTSVSRACNPNEVIRCEETYENSITCTGTVCSGFNFTGHPVPHEPNSATVTGHITTFYKCRTLDEGSDYSFRPDCQINSIPNLYCEATIQRCVECGDDGWTRITRATHRAPRAESRLRDTCEGRYDNFVRSSGSESSSNSAEPYQFILTQGLVTIAGDSSVGQSSSQGANGIDAGNAVPESTDQCIQ